MSQDTAFEIGMATRQLTRIANLMTGEQSDLFVRLPGLIGYFPLGITTPVTGKAVNHAGGDVDLAETGTCPIGYDGNSYRKLGGGVNYLGAAGYVTTGLETYIGSGLRGLTVGGWFSLSGSPSNSGGMISKDGVAGQRAFGLYTASDNSARFWVSPNGTDWVQAVGDTVSLGDWEFIVGRFTPSTEVAVFVSGEKDVNVTSVPASVPSSTQDFELGRYANNNSFTYNGRARDVFVCQAVLSDTLLEELMVSSRPG